MPPSHRFIEPAMNARPLLLPTVAIAILLAGCSPPQPAPEAVRAVRTMTLGADIAGGTIEYAAEVRARTEVRLGFRVPGKMVARSAEVGQRVKAGQVLAQLDAADLRLGQDSAAASTRAAQANFDVVAAEFKRYRELRDQGFISALELERRSSALQAAQSQLDQAKAQGLVQGNQAGYAALTAPGAGVVIGVDAEPGAVLAVGASAVRLALDGPRDAVFSVPEDSLAAMRGLQGKPGALKVRPWGGQALLPATVREVAAAADPVTRTFLVKAALGATALQLGQTLTVVIEQPRQAGVMRLPLSAVMQHQGQSAVWLLDKASMTVKPQPVQVAGADGNTLVVAAGLSPGQTVVTAGVHVLTPGQKVKLFEAVASAKP
jgi:membrane fusion protein, multidrug efflux system